MRVRRFFVVMVAILAVIAAGLMVLAPSASASRSIGDFGHGALPGPRTPSNVTGHSPDIAHPSAKHAIDPTTAQGKAVAAFADKARRSSLGGLPVPSNVPQGLADLSAASKAMDAEGTVVSSIGPDSTMWKESNSSEPPVSYDNLPKMPLVHAIPASTPSEVAADATAAPPIPSVPSSNASPSSTGSPAAFTSASPSGTASLAGRRLVGGLANSSIIQNAAFRPATYTCVDQAGGSGCAACGGDSNCADYYPHPSIVVPSYETTGKEAVTLYNVGQHPWTAGHFALGYHIYLNNAQHTLVRWTGRYEEPLAADLNPGQNVTIVAPIEELNPGNYIIAWDIYYSVSTGSGWFSGMSPDPVPTGSISFTVNHSAPTATYASPAYDGATVNSLTPALQVSVASDGTQTLDVQIQACKKSAPSTCFTSAWMALSSPTSGTATWTVPAGDFYWENPYEWKVNISDPGTTPYGWSTPIEVIPVVVQPKQAELGSSPNYLDDQGVNMFLGQYVRSENDLNLGPNPNPLEITRTYNSSDTVAHAFGIGWGSALDAKWVWGTGNNSFAVTFPDGSQRAYAKNPDGTWAGGYGDPYDHNVDPTNRTIFYSGVKYTFDPADGLIAALAPDSHHVLQFVQTSGVITSVKSLYSGRTIYLTWSGGRIHSESTNEAGALNLTWNFTYNTTGTLATVCSPRSTTACTQYNYDASKRLTKVTPPAGTNTVTVNYASDSTVSSIVYPDGTWSYTRTMEAPSYDPSGLQETVVGVTDPRESVYYRFNANGALMDRDLQNRTAEEAFVNIGDWQNVVYDYDESGNLVEMLDQNQIPTYYTEDTVVGGIKTTTTWPDSNAATGNTSTITRQQPTSPGDYSVGLPLTATDANGHITRYSYGTGGDGLLRTETDPTGSGATATTTHVYTCDTGAAPASVNDPAGLAVGTQPCGALASTKDPLGHTTTYAYDAEGDRTQEVDPTGKSTNMWYDPNGNLVKETVTTPQNPAGATTTFGYDSLGELTSVLGPAVTNPVTGDVNQLQTTQTWTMDGDVFTKTATPIVNGAAQAANARTTTYAYDARDRPTKVTENGTVTSQTSYNAFGQPATTTTGNGFVTDYVYYAEGQLNGTAIIGYVNPVGYPSAGSTRNITRTLYTYYATGQMYQNADPLGNVLDAYHYWPDGNLANDLTQVGPSASPDVITRHSDNYDAAGNATSDVATGGLGVTRTTNMTYDNGNHRVSATLDPSALNRATTYGYDLNGNLTTVTASQGGRTETATASYDAGGQLSSQTVNNSPSNLTTAVRMDAYGKPLSVTDPRGVSSTGTINPAYSTTSAYDTLDELSTVTKPVTATQDGSGGAATNKAAVTSYGYDAFGDQTQVKYDNGYTVTTSYDGLARKVSQTGSATAGQSDGWSESWAYDHDNNITSHTDRRGQKTTYTYDGLDRISQVTYPPTAAGGTAGVATYVFDDDNNLVSYVDPTGAQTLATYDQLSRMLSKTVIDRVPTSTTIETDYTYDDFGDLLSQTDKTSGNTISYTYDAAGHQLTKTVTGQGTITYTRDVAGRTTKEIDPNGTSTATTYDLAGRPTSVVETGSNGTTTRTVGYGYDAAGNRTSATDARGYATTYAFDARSQVVTQTDPAVHTIGGSAAPQPKLTYAYDDMGDKTAVTTGNGNATYTTYDNQGRLLGTVAPSTTAQPDVSQRTTSYAYNAAGDVVAVTRPGGAVITNAYDNLGDLTTQTGTLAGAPTVTNTYGYDADQRLTSYSEPNGTGQVSYDDRGLPVQVADWTSPTTSKVANNSYNSLGQLTSAGNPAGTANYTYANGLLATIQEASSTTGYGLSYDAAGRLKTETVYQGTLGTASNANATINYGYDPFSRIGTQTYTTVAGANRTSGAPLDTGTLSYAWDVTDNLTTQTATGKLANDTSNQAYSYDEAGRLISDVVTHTNGSTTGTDDTWDADGNRLTGTPWTGSVSSKADGPTTTYTYDARDRITGSTGGVSGNSVAYTYDPQGDRTQTATTSGGTTQTDTLNYDALGQLVTDTRAGPGNYVYDSLGRLITQPGDSVALQYSGLSKEPDAGNGWTTLRGPDGQIYSDTSTGTGGATNTVVSNPHGDVQALLNTNGNVAETNSYDPFGNRTTQTTTTTDGTTTKQPAPIGWQGSLFNATTGLVHAENRNYDPASGQFLTADPAPGPVTTVASANHYGYGNADPATFADPTGNNAATCEDVVVGGASDPLEDLDIPGLLFQAVSDIAACGPDAVEGIENLVSGGGASTASTTTKIIAGTSATTLAVGSTAGGLGQIGQGSLQYPANPLDGDPNDVDAAPSRGPSAPPQVAVPIPAPPPTVVDTTYTNWSIAAAPQSFRSHGNGNVYVRHVQTTTYYQQTLQDLSNGDINVWTNSWTKTVSTVQVIPITDFHPPVAHSIRPTLPISGQSLPPSGDDKDCGDGGQADECLPGSQASLPGTGLAPATQTGGGGNQAPPPVTPGSSSCEDEPNNAANNADDGQHVYRIHGGKAGPLGRSWTPEDPRGMANPRDLLGLPKANAGQFLSKARVLNDDGVLRRDALPIEEDGVAGGGPEWVFPDPANQLDVQWTIPLEPPC